MDREFLKKIIKHLKRFYSKKEYELNRIKKLPRYTEFETKLIKNKFKGIDSASFIGQYREIIERGIYTFKTDKTDPFIIDCGSNIGLSLVAYKSLYPNAKIIAFEPDPNIFRILKYNINLLQFRNIDIFQKAVWNKETTIRFLQEGSAGGHIASDPLHKGKTIDVEAIRLFNFFSGRVDFLKIDIEGAECEVLMDIQEKLPFVERIFIEYHSKINKNQNLSTILSILEESNFRYYLEPGMAVTNHPFITTRINNGFDNLINIFGFRKK